VAHAAATIADALTAPVLAYAPAPFNMAFPGTVSISPATFKMLAGEIFSGLRHHGFRHIYVLNGHGANLAPLAEAAETARDCAVRIRSWWDFETVNRIRAELYGDWEGMHATPSEIAIVEALHGAAMHAQLPPPEKLSADYIRAHAGDRHGAPEAHRARFPDGRVGSHSSLARPEHGHNLLAAAAAAVAEDYRAFLGA